MTGDNDDTAKMEGDKLRSVATVTGDDPVSGKNFLPKEHRVNCLAWQLRYCC